MNNIIYDDLDNLISEIIASTDFLRLKELKKIIDEKFGLLNVQNQFIMMHYQIKTIIRILIR